MQKQKSHALSSYLEFIRIRFIMPNLYAGTRRIRDRKATQIVICAANRAADKASRQAVAGGMTKAPEEQSHTAPAKRDRFHHRAR
jgi:hypothetical protein